MTRELRFHLLIDFHKPVQKLRRPLHPLLPNRKLHQLLDHLVFTVRVNHRTTKKILRRLIQLRGNIYVFNSFSVLLLLEFVDFGVNDADGIESMGVPRIHDLGFAPRRSR